MPLSELTTGRRARALASAALLTVLAGCSTGVKPAPPGPAAASVTIMTFNVENLFDTRHDEGKNDLTYLPLSAKEAPEHVAACAEISNERWRNDCLHWDWSEAALSHKLGVLAAAILQVNNGRGPDIVALAEVENLAVLERLRIDYLGAANYRPAILVEGNDLRGIDVAYLSRLEPVGEALLHPIAFPAFDDRRVEDTRGILEATFRLPGGSLLTGYAVHFPAPYHPFEMRIVAYGALNRLAAGLPPDRLVFAAGDFNTPSAEDARENMLERFVEPYWLVSHASGCGDCKGSYYYARNDEWSFLDMLLLSRNLADNGNAPWHFAAGSLQVANKGPGQMAPNGAPARFTLPGPTGVSDHWPLVVTLRPR